MGTFYGYAEREAGSYVDWSQIGKDITDMLQEEVVRRETLKKELADASTAYGETLANAPTGLHEDTNKGIIDFASNAQQARLMQDRLLKSGQLKVKDYILQRENLTQGTKQAFEVKRKFEEVFQEKVEKATSGEGAGLEMELFKLTEGFGNFSNAGFFINPTDYKISAAKKIKKEAPNGDIYYEMSKSPEDFFTMPELMAFASLNLDKFDVNEAFDKLADSYGEVVKTTLENGKLITIEDITTDVIFDQLEDPGDQKLVYRFNKTLKQQLKAMLNNKYDAASIAYDTYGVASNGKPYRFVWKEEEAEKNPEAILLKKDPANKIPTPVFSEKEETFLIKKMMNEVKVRLKQKYEEKTEFRPDFQREKYYRERGDKKEQAKSFVKDWVESVAGGSDQGLATTASANVRNTLTYKGNPIVKVQKTTNAKGEPVIQMKYKDEASGSIIDLTDIPLSDKKAYIRAIRGFLPSDVSKEVSDKELEAMGLDVWKDGSNNKAFNAYDVNSGIGISITDPSTMGIEFDDKTFATVKTVQDAITEINKAGKGGIFGTSNVEKRKVLVEVQNKQTERVNEDLQSIGEDPINLTTNSDNQYGIFTNGNNQVRIEFGDATGLPAAQNLFHSAILKYGSGVINENELRNEAKQFVEDYRQAMVKNLGKNPQTDGLIIIGGTPRSTNYLQTPKGFGELVNAMKGLATTTGGTAGTGKPKFRPYDPTKDTSMADYVAKKKAYENQ